LNTKPAQAGDASLAEALEARHSSERFRKTDRNDFELFRYWNVAAAKRQRTGFGEFLATMREGNEAYAAHRFPQVSNG
jgi:hypothetical protein